MKTLSTFFDKCVNWANFFQGFKKCTYFTVATLIKFRIVIFGVFKDGFLFFSFRSYFQFISIHFSQIVIDFLEIIIAFSQRFFYQFLSIFIELTNSPSHFLPYLVCRSVRDSVTYYWNSRNLGDSTVFLFPK